MTATTAARRRIPLFPTLAGYQRSWLGRDILAGVSAGAVVIPQAMAYATIANLPVQAGLYTCTVPMFVYAMLGGSRAMSVSTTSTIATLTATTLVSVGVAAHSDDIPRDLVTLTLLVGIILLVARLLRLGSLVEIINRPTLLGIQVGVGATVAVGQLPKLLGEESQPTGEGFIRSIVAVIEAIPHANLATTLLSAGSIAALFLFKRFLPRVPGPLIVVVVGILLVAFGVFNGAGVDQIPPVAQGIPLPTLPSLQNVVGLVPGAFAIAVMAFLESAAVARGIRDPGDRPIDSNQELLATAGASLIGGFFQTLPAAGGFSQSAVNRAAGARSQLAALVTVALALLVGLFLGPIIGLLPQATLASLVFVAVFGLIDVRTLASLWRISRRDFWVAMVTTLVGLTAGLLVAVATGVVLTLILLLSALNKPRIATAAGADGELVVSLLAPLYTANVLGTEQAVLAAADAQPGLTVLVLDMSVLQEISFTVIETLEDLDRELAGRGVELRLSRLPAGARAVAERTGWFSGLEGAGRVIR
ncbi:SulP family inorganic anion transporter [Leifsonia poae]|uniref:Sodium-independent anion transporter n=1 Tax=Leifsonia poae TaxID=110933 RepID=A0A9W6H9Z7_9MICO|nr:SulP family inorganic anion transporter [Leifsonia poae]GLJ76301.1 sodium-independent anion transporter [Leifsonia poae]